MKPGRALGHPCDELRQPWMCAKSLDRVVGPCEFRLRQRGVDFPMADVMQQYSWPAFAALQLRDQVMQALRRIWRNWTTAQRAGRVRLLCVF